MNHSERNKKIQQIEVIEKGLDELKQLDVFDSRIYGSVNQFLTECKSALKDKNKKIQSGEDSIDVESVLTKLIAMQMLIVKQNTTPNTMKLEELAKGYGGVEDETFRKAVCFGLLTGEFGVQCTNLSTIDTTGKIVQAKFDAYVNQQQTTLFLTTRELHDLYVVYCLLEEKTNIIRNIVIGIKNKRSPEDNIVHLLEQIEVILQKQDEQERSSRENEEQAIRVEKRIYANLLEIGALLVAIVGFISFNLSAVSSQGFNLSSLYFINIIFIVGISILMMLIAIVLYRNKEGLNKAFIMLCVMVVMLIVVTVFMIVAYPHINNILLGTVRKGR